jgi:hypothetical protein
MIALSPMAERSKAMDLKADRFRVDAQDLTPIVPMKDPLT